MYKCASVGYYVNECIREPQIEYISLQCNFYLLFLKHIAHPVIIIIVWTAVFGSYCFIKCVLLSLVYTRLSSAFNVVIWQFMCYTICEWICTEAYCRYLAKEFFFLKSNSACVWTKKKRIVHFAMLQYLVKSMDAFDEHECYCFRSTLYGLVYLNGRQGVLVCIWIKIYDKFT